MPTNTVNIKEGFCRLEYNAQQGFFHFANVGAPPPTGPGWQVLMASISYSNAEDFSIFADENILPNNPNCSFTTMLQLFHQWLAES